MPFNMNEYAGLYERQCRTILTTIHIIKNRTMKKTHIRFKKQHPKKGIVDAMSRKILANIKTTTTNEEVSTPKKTKAERPSVGSETRMLIDMLEEQYEFRFNTMLGCTEMRSRKDPDSPWRIADERMLNSMTIQARLQGINVWGNETRRYLFSQSIEDYDPIDDYLKHLRGRWDGKDHVALLAATVSTNNKLWPLWLRRWLLAMVAQWTGKNQNYGNAVAPLLVAPQGYHKSTFCRQLLPPALRWGYADGLQVSQKQQMLQAMSQLLLINLDEFNQISRQAQEGFVKNMMQMAVVKARRPYGTRLEDLPRRASFIATSNMTDVLTDPSGSRRFLVVEVNSPINTDTPIDHDQLYAQLLDALDRGERYWFNDEESSAIIAHNRQYQRLTPAEQCFYEYFAPAPNENQGQWLTTSTIFTELRQRTGAIIPPNGLLAFGRTLSQSSNLRRRRTHQGTEYLVRHL